jgi:DNA-binding transcriptional regulator YdaS (Cro superfamily)
MESPIAALERAIRDHFKSQSALARLVGKTPQNISDLIKREREVPAEWCIPIDLATGHSVSCHDLRPDLWPATFDPKQEMAA